MTAFTRRTLPLLALSTLLVACGLAWAQGGRGGRGQSAAVAELSAPPLARDEAEKKILDVLAEMGADRELRYLLSDLELVLAQILRVSARENQEDMEWVNESLKDRALLPRLRNKIPAGKTAMTI